MQRSRPTLRCLREDLELAVPGAEVPLDEVDHPLLAKATKQFTSDVRHERIRSIDDQILFKVKVQRWRGAVWTEDDLPWLVAGGLREDGSGDDFYTALETDAKAARARYNTEHATPLATTTRVDHLLPGDEDRIRYQLEAGTRLLRRLIHTIHDLVRASLGDGREHSADFSTFILGIQVRADQGHETYVAVRITGSISGDLMGLILDVVPGCEPDAWFPEGRLPQRLLYGAEQAWSTLMDPKAAAQLLEEQP